jgi:hypothetical protein
MTAYQAEYQRYGTAWNAFAILPGVTRVSDSQLQYPQTMTPPRSPSPARAPVDLSQIKDNDPGLAFLGMLTKGRADDALEKSFRDAFGKMGIVLK